MALKRLSIEEMIQISRPWVTAGDAAYEVFQKIPLLTALYPTLQAAHLALFSLRGKSSDPRAQRLSEEAAFLDDKHDELVRGIHVALTVLASLSEASDEILRLRDLLLPEGLSHTTKTYRGQAGHAALVNSMVDASTKTALKALTLNDKNMLDLVQGWLDVSQKLGDLEETRARLNSPIGNSAAEINLARLTWVRVVNAILANSELIGLDEDMDHTLFAALRLAEKTADGRGRVSEDGNPVPTSTTITNMAPTPAA